MEPLFQAAWDGLHTGLGTPVNTVPPNTPMQRLDDFTWKADTVMPADRWKVWPGKGTKELIDTTNAEAMRMSGEKTKPFQIEEAPNSYIALGLLDHQLIFKKPLHRAKNAPLEFRSADGTTLKVFFGTRGKASGALHHVVHVLAFQPGTHALKIHFDSEDAAILYIPERPMTFNEACKKLRELRKNKLTGEDGSVQDPSLHDHDDVRIPFLELTNSTDFRTQLASARIYGNAGDPWKVDRAEQHLKFALTEKGAELRVKVEMAVAPFGDAPKPKPIVPRIFHYDRPFFVFLWRDDAEWPYFGAWIGNSATMEPFKAP